MRSAIARLQAIVAIVLIAIAAVDHSYYYMTIAVPPPQNGSTPSLSPMSMLVPNTYYSHAYTNANFNADACPCSGAHTDSYSHINSNTDVNNRSEVLSFRSYVGWMH